MLDRNDGAACSPVRVLTLASTFPRWQGDTEPPFVFNLSRDLARHFGFDVTVAAPHAPGASCRENLDGLRVRRFRYLWPQRLQRLAYGGMLPNLKRNPWLWLEVPFFLLAELAAGWRLIRSERIDVIHAHWLIPQGVVGAALSRFTGKPLVITAHGADVYGVGGRLQTALKRWALRSSTHITAVSTDLRDAIERLRQGDADPVPVAVISMGVDTALFHPSRRDPCLKERIAGDGPLLLFVGRLAEKKGVRYLIEAMPAILERFPEAKLLIVGGGPLEAELREQVRTSQLGDRIIFAGARCPEELPPYYASADLFVGPSVVSDGDREGVPVSFMEAMASGCPILASGVGGIRDLIQDGKTGVLVPERDPGSIAEQACGLLAHPALRRGHAIRARRSVRRRYSSGAVAGRYAEVLLTQVGAKNVTATVDGESRS